jgi:predicted lactoylglutathione lyase
MIRPFLPSKDFEASKRFYQALGFTRGFNDGSLAPRARETSRQAA